MKRYKDFNYHSRSNVKRSSQVKNSFITSKSIGFIIGIALLLFVVKIFAQPIGSALAGLLRETSASVSGLLSNESLRETDGVTTILLLGVDQRVEGQSSLTDTVMLANYNHTDRSVTIVSFPRDLWVTIPAFGDLYEHGSKINAVYSIGQSYEYVSDNDQLWSGGVGLLQKVLSENLGIPIHYYALVNFGGFKNVVDAVDGVDIYVNNTFTDYEYPKEGYENAPWDTRWEVISFEQGWQHMDGTTALKFARSRHAFGPEGSDFARAARQQAVILAIKEKVFSSQTFFNLNKLRQLYTVLASDFETNVTVSGLPAFYNLYSEIGDFEAVKTYVLSNDSSREGGLLYEPSPDEFGGAYVLLPRDGWGAVKDFVDSLIR